MLILAGTGLKIGHLTKETIDAMQKSAKVYIDTYTSRLVEGNLEDLDKIAGKKVIALERSMMEENFNEILKEAKTQDVIVLVIGNPLFATTHQQIIIDAEKEGIKVEIQAGIAIFDLIGKTGLSPYKFGKTTSIVLWEKNYSPESFYDTIISNMKINAHTLCLLDIKPDRLMTPKKAIEELLTIEEKRGKDNIKNSEIFIISKAGSKNEKIVFGKITDLKEKKFDTPCSIIVCSKISEKEREFTKKWKI